MKFFSPELSSFPHKSKKFSSTHSLHNAILKICLALLAVRNCARAKILQLNEFNIFSSVLLKSSNVKQRVSRMFHINTPWATIYSVTIFFMLKTKGIT